MLRAATVISMMHLLLPVAVHAAAGQDDRVEAHESDAATEGLVVRGEPSLGLLRAQMWEAEKRAYEVFNRFNDEDRFNISCSMHQPTGTRLRTQVCQARFEQDASRAHAQAFHQNFRDFLDPETPADAPPRHYQPVQFVIAGQQEDFRRKMRQVAREHPEFLEALVQHSEARSRYDAATGRSEAQD
jgi:hypothetical protein